MKTALILATHGSAKKDSINQPMFELADRIGARLPNVFVTPAFLDGTPDVRSVIADIEQDDVFVVPFMASQGYYTDVVFPKSLHHPDKQIQFAEAIGSNARLVDLVDSRISKLSEQFELATGMEVVVVGHGTRKNKNSCRTTIDLVQAIRKRRPDQRVEFAFIDQNPGIEHVSNRLTGEHILIIPFLMGLGPHATDDIPEGFGIKSIADHVFAAEFEFPIVAQHSQQTLLYDAPVGTYPELAELCVDLFTNRHIDTKPLKGAVA